MAKGLQSWSVKESGAPVTSAEIKSATFSASASYSFSSSTRAIMGVTAATGSGTLTLTLAGGGTLVIPNAAINSVFAPGSIVPFACDSFVFSAEETAFAFVGLF
jgi:hypothetical protein